MWYRQYTLLILASWFAFGATVPVSAASSEPAAKPDDDWSPAGLRPFQVATIREVMPDLYRLLLRGNYLAAWVGVGPRTEVAVLRREVEADRFVYRIVSRSYSGESQHYTAQYEKAMTGRVPPTRPYEEKVREIEAGLALRIVERWTNALLDVSYRHVEPVFKIDGAEYFFGAMDWGVFHREEALAARATEADRQYSIRAREEEARDGESIRYPLPMLGYVWSPRSASPAGRMVALGEALHRYGAATVTAGELATILASFPAMPLAAPPPTAR